MIERKTIQNLQYMQGFTMSYTSKTISVGEGTIDSCSLPAIQFDLVYDVDVPVLHDLYIEKVGQGYDYFLMATYLDGRTQAFYEKDGELFHRLMTVETRPDRTYRGDFVFIEKLEKGEGAYGQDTNPNNKEEPRTN